jgi:hypothetical protein
VKFVMNKNQIDCCVPWHMDAYVYLHLLP